MSNNEKKVQPEQQPKEEQSKESRGCGERVDDGLYVCVDTSLYGEPLEYFMVDEPIPFNHKVLRSPMLVEDREGIVHVVLGIGKNSYPFVPDFMEETRNMGISKRIPRNFDPSSLTPDKSKLVLVHSRAIPKFNYKLLEPNSSNCPKNITHPHKCIGDLWSLSSLQSISGKHELSEIKGVTDKLLVTTPSAKYQVAKVAKAEQPKYATGIVLAFPKFHFEYVNKKHEVPVDVKQHITKAGFSLEVHEK